MRTLIFTGCQLICGYVLLLDAGADELSGRQLAQYCVSQKAPEHLACISYIAGFGDGMVAGTASTLDMTKGKVCIPQNISGATAKAIFQKFALDHPENLKESAGTVLTIAMWKAYPCK